MGRAGGRRRGAGKPKTDGDASYDTPEMKAARAALRHDESVSAALDEWWEATDVDGSGFVDREEYIELGKALYRVMIADGDEAAAQSSAEDDWVEDCGGEAVMSGVRFRDAIFQLCDLWTEGLDPADYVAFSRDLLTKMQAAGLGQGWTIAPPEHSPVLVGAPRGFARAGIEARAAEEAAAAKAAEEEAAARAAAEEAAAKTAEEEAAARAAEEEARAAAEAAEAQAQAAEWAAAAEAAEEEARLAAKAKHKEDEAWSPLPSRPTGTPPSRRPARRSRGSRKDRRTREDLGEFDLEQAPRSSPEAAHDETEQATRDIRYNHEQLAWQVGRRATEFPYGFVRSALSEIMDGRTGDATAAASADARGDADADAAGTLAPAAFTNFDLASEHSLSVPVHPDGAITELRAVIAVWDHLHNTNGLPPLLSTPKDHVECRRAQTASAARRTAAAQQAAMQRAVLHAERQAKMNTARVAAEREANWTAREEARNFLANKLAYVPPSPSRPSTAAAASRQPSPRSTAGSPRQPPPPLRPPSAPAWPLPRAMAPSRQLDGERDAYLTRWWCDGGGRGSSSLTAVFPATLSGRERGWQACSNATQALRGGCLHSAVKQFNLAQELAPNDVRLKWALRDGELQMAIRDAAR